MIVFAILVVDSITIQQVFTLWKEFSSETH